jgi:uncharacterized protein
VIYNRLISLTKSNSFFLFGQRGTGKSHLMRSLFSDDRSIYINLLDNKEYYSFSTNLGELENRISAARRSGPLDWVVIDEIQKLPRLLDSVHKLIEAEGIKFALTGSSARKLKAHASNLLAGRAFLYKLFPLTHNELGEDFDLQRVLTWGTLPKVINTGAPEDREEFLFSYVQNYLQEEISFEQKIRRIEPFTNFLKVAGQGNGDIVNFSNIEKDTGISRITVKTYFEILEQTLIGFFLYPFHQSIRKRQKKAPKFYFFDLGLVRTLQNRVSLPVAPETFEYGNLFETFVVNEILRLSEYRRKRFQLSYFRTQDDAEIDLVIERPGEKLALIEIKSRDRIFENHVAALNRLAPEFGNAEAFCFSNQVHATLLGKVHCLNWKDGLRALGLV